MLLQRINKTRLHDHPPHLSHQQGMVIVVALFIVALVATMATMMMSRLERDTRRTSLIMRDAQAELYAEGSIAWAIDQLRNDWKKRKPKQLVDAIPIKSPVMHENGYQIFSTIYDMQGRYNLNNLTVPDEQVGFKRMLQGVVPKITEQKAQQVVSAISDWVINRPMLSVSELCLVKGVTADIFNALHPYVIALPAPTTVNIQNATAPVIATLGSSMTLESAMMVVKQLQAMPPLTSIEDFSNLDIIRNHPVTPEKITIMSSYFLVETEVTIENQHVVLYTLLERATDTRKPVISILWQSKGIW